MALADAGFTDGHDVEGIADERATTDVLHLLLDDEREPLELQRLKRLLGRQPGLPEWASDPALRSQDALALHDVGEVSLVREVRVGGVECQAGDVTSHTGQRV